MAAKSKYIFQIHPLVISEDLPALTSELRIAFSDEYRSILSADPYGCKGFPNHDLKGRLQDFWAGITPNLDIHVNLCSERYPLRLAKKHGFLKA